LGGYVHQGGNMVLKSLDICPDGHASVKGMDGHLVFIQFGTQSAGEQADGVDKKNSG